MDLENELRAVCRALLNLAGVSDYGITLERQPDASERWSARLRGGDLDGFMIRTPVLGRERHEEHGRWSTDDPAFPGEDGWSTSQLVTGHLVVRSLRRADAAKRLDAKAVR